MATANHRETIWVLKVTSPRKSRHLPLAGINQLGLALTFCRRRPHAKQTIFGVIIQVRASIIAGFSLADIAATPLLDHNLLSPLVTYEVWSAQVMAAFRHAVKYSGASSSLQPARILN